MVAIGEFVGLHGVRGELKLGKSPRWFDGNQLFSQGFIGDEKDLSEKIQVLQMRWNKYHYLIMLENIQTADATSEFVGKNVYLEEMPALENGEHYVKDILGLTVFDGDTQIGKVSDVYLVSGNSMLSVVDDDGKEIMIPIQDEFIQKMDLENGQIICQNVEGLLECA